MPVECAEDSRVLRVCPVILSTLGLPYHLATVHYLRTITNSVMLYENDHIHILLCLVCMYFFL